MFTFGLAVGTVIGIALVIGIQYLTNNYKITKQ